MEQRRRQLNQKSFDSFLRTTCIGKARCFDEGIEENEMIWSQMTWITSTETESWIDGVVVISNSTEQPRKKADT